MVVGNSKNQYLIQQNQRRKRFYQPTQFKPSHQSGAGVIALGVFLSCFGAFPSAIAAKEIDINVGIVQRFGEEPNDTMTVSSTSGGLSLACLNEQNATVAIEAASITLEPAKAPYSVPQIREWLVLSDHATFETAEDSARSWQAKGLKVEVTQPGRWQVWGDRKAYRTPLLRRWLLRNLKAQGYDRPYLETALVSQQPYVALKTDSAQHLCRTIDFSSASQQIKVNHGEHLRTYQGTFRVQPNSYGTFTLVNRVNIETYLRGVVPHEIGPNAPNKAIEAQAIIARTYALRNLRRFKADQYELCSTVHCQVFWGLGHTSSRADQAIAATKGLVLTYQGELVDALYSSTTGGVTARFGDIWNGQERPYLQAVIDAPNPVWDLTQTSLANEASFRQFINLNQGFNEAGRKVFRWNRQSSLPELGTDLRKYLSRIKHPLAKFKQIQWMEVTERSPSGRILQLRVTTDLGLVELQKTEVRSAFGPPTSTLFYLEPIYGANQQLQAFAFVGGGLGHGVGLSQYGSYNLANLGWSAQQILAFYYPGTSIQALNDGLVFWRDPDLVSVNSAP